MAQGGCWSPLIIAPPGNLSPRFISFALNGTTDGFAQIIQIPKTGTLDWFEFRTGAVTTFQSLRCSFQDPGGDGLPDGTADQFRVISATPGANAWAVPPGVMTSDGTDTGVKRSVTRGDLLACVIEFDATAGDLEIAYSDRMTGQDFPYLASKDAGVWTKIRETLVLALKYSDGTYAEIPACHPGVTLNAINVNTGSTPDIVGARFRLPFACKVDAAFTMHIATTGADWRMLIVADDWDGSEGAILAKTNTIDSDVSAAIVTGSLILFTSEVNLSANTWYRVVLEPLTANNCQPHRVLSIASQARLDTFDLGQDFYWTEAKDPTGVGSWTNTVTTVPWLSLRISSIGVMTVAASQDAALVDASTVAVTPLLAVLNDPIGVVDTALMAIDPLLLAANQDLTMVDASTAAVTPLLVSVFDIPLEPNSFEFVKTAVTPLLLTEFQAISLEDAGNLAVDPLIVTQFDLVNLLDAVAVAVTPLVVNIFDTLTVADIQDVQIQGGVDLLVNVNDTLTATDVSTAAVTPLLLSLFEPGTVTDVSVQVVTPLIVSVLESELVSDVASEAVTPLVASVFDAIGIVDFGQANIFLSGALSLNVFEAINILDGKGKTRVPIVFRSGRAAKVVVFPLIVSASEELALFDAFDSQILTNVLTLSVSEAVTVLEVLSRYVNPMLLSAVELASVADVGTLAVTPLVISQFELVGITDAANASAGLVVFQAEVITLADFTNEFVDPLTVQQADLIAVIEAGVVAVDPLTAIVFDALSITDFGELVLSGGTQLNISGAESVVLSDISTVAVDFLLLALFDGIMTADISTAAVDPLMVALDESAALVDVLAVAVDPLIVKDSESLLLDEALTLYVDPLVIVGLEPVPVFDALNVAVDPLIIALFESILALDVATMKFPQFFIVFELLTDARISLALETDARVSFTIELNEGEQMFFFDNDNLVALNGVLDQEDGTYLNAATITAKLETISGTQLIAATAVPKVVGDLTGKYKLTWDQSLFDTIPSGTHRLIIVGSEAGKDFASKTKVRLDYRNIL